MFLDALFCLTAWRMDMSLVQRDWDQIKETHWFHSICLKSLLNLFLDNYHWISFKTSPKRWHSFPVLQRNMEVKGKGITSSQFGTNFILSHDINGFRVAHEGCVSICSRWKKIRVNPILLPNSISCSSVYLLAGFFFEPLLLIDFPNLRLNIFFLPMNEL